METYSARDQVNNGVAIGMDMSEVLGDGVTENDPQPDQGPHPVKSWTGLTPSICLILFPGTATKIISWPCRGFHDLTHEWDRTHHAENFDQIDSRAYLVHSWMKYPKFGHAAATDYTARYIRYGMMTARRPCSIKERDGAGPLCARFLRVLRLHRIAVLGRCR